MNTYQPEWREDCFGRFYLYVGSYPIASVALINNEWTASATDIWVPVKFPDAESAKAAMMKTITQP